MGPRYGDLRHWKSAGFLMRDRKGWTWMERKVGGTGRNKGKGNCNQNILCEENMFSGKRREEKKASSRIIEENYEQR